MSPTDVRRIVNRRRQTMTTATVASRLVQLCNAGKGEQAMKDLYAKDIVSIEAQGTPEMPARMQGIDAVQKKGEWWASNNTVHGMKAVGPFIGNKADQFAVMFEMEITPKGGARTKMTEVGLYTVKNDKIVEEAFTYSA
jgi:SnoaL-like domain